MSIERQFDAHFFPWQQALLEQIIYLRQKNQLPHGLIIQSQMDSDLTPFLWYLATDLLCQTDGVLACGKCKACQLMSANSFPDMLFVTKQYDEKKKKLKRDIAIDQIRKLIYEFSLTNHYDTLKIAVIYPAEAMNASAANALLKTLEEPENESLIILATHRIGLLPVTIRSRCQTFQLPAPGARECADFLLKESQINEETVSFYEHLSILDPQTILELEKQDFKQRYQDFYPSIAGIISGKQEVVSLVSEMAALPIKLLRLLLINFVDQMLRYHCGQENSGLLNAQFGAVSKNKAQHLFQQRMRYFQQLQFEENNLNIQLQLEDVIISLQKILGPRG